MNRLGFFSKSLLFLLVAVFITLVFLFGRLSIPIVLADVQPPNFPDCRDKIFSAPGDWAHYDRGIHGIPGVGNLEGSDDVYSLGSGNFLQCFCPLEGSNGWQTNWWDVDIAGLSDEEISRFISQGWLFEQSGSGWNLLDDRYLIKNSNFSCARPTPAPPGGPVGAPVCNAPAVSKAPLYSRANLSRIDADSIKITWIVTDGHAQKYGIYYGTDPNKLPWYTEVKGHETNEVVINLVPPGNIFFKVCSIGECGDQVCGSEIPSVLGAAKGLPVTGNFAFFILLLVPFGYYLYKRFRLL